MENDTVNQDRNAIGRLGALLVIALAVVGVGRVCGMSSPKFCPFVMGGHSCPLVSPK